MKGLLVFGALGALWVTCVVTACSGGTATGGVGGAGGAHSTSASGAMVCQPGKVDACPCLGAAQMMGVQTCADDGKSWGACMGCPDGSASSSSSSSSASAGGGGSSSTAASSSASSSGAGGAGGGPPMCGGSPCQFTCCGSACVDLKSDPANCGACGHDCLGSTCASSACSPIVLADTWGPYDLAIDASYVYWTSLGQNQPAAAISKVPKAGGVVTIIASKAGGFDVNNPRGIAVDAGSVYWTNYGTKTAMMCGLSGPPCSKLATSPTPPYNMSSNSDALYFTTDGGGLYSTNKVGGGIALISATAGYSCVASDGQNIAFRDGNNIVLTDLAGGSSFTLTPGGCTDIVLDPLTAFWTNGPTVNAIPRAGGQLVNIASFQGDAHGIAVDATHVYWITYGPSIHYVRKAPKSGGPDATLSTYNSMFQPRESLAVDGQFVYWIEEGSPGHVLKVAK